MAEHSFGKKFLALLATGRVANLPTVWSNVIVAFCLVTTLRDTSASRFHEKATYFEFWQLFFVCLASSCLYIGGCMLGDYRDIQFDKKNRPSRPLVTGLLSPSLVFITSLSLITLGLIIGSLGNITALMIVFDVPFSAFKNINKDEIKALLQPTHLTLLCLLIIFIVIYALFHKRSRPLALFNMALCRTQLVIFAAASSIPLFALVTTSSYVNSRWLSSPIIVIATSVGVYTLLLASVAATESNKDKIKFSLALKASMFLLPALAVAALAFNGSQQLPLFSDLAATSATYSTNTLRGYFIGTIVVYCGWMIHAFGALPHDKPAFVSRALAGFCLLDACFAATYSVTIPLICIILFGLALLLQKITPAT